jgi:acyl-CoA synthetase (NDP forming)
MTVPQDPSRTKLARLLSPRTIAVVGMKDGSPFEPYFRPTLESDARIVMVNPRYDSVLGFPSHPTLTSVGEPVDAVYCVTNAEVTVAVAEEAAGLDVGGLVLVAGGFAEVGAEGARLQQRLVDAASGTGFAVMGPNGLGFVNVPRRISLTIASDHKRRPGGVSVVSQSGALLSGVAMAAWERPAIGLNVLVSAGNEAVTDLAEYVDHLVDDPATTAIGLIVETVRRPREFFTAVDRAIAAGKPVVALKLARSDRTRELAASHTGALAGDAWAYEVAFRQAGIGVARDPEELLDRLAVVEQLDPAYRVPVHNLAIVTFTGGFASMSGDLAADEGIEVPALDELRPWVRQNFPGVTVPNPLDATVFGHGRWEEILERYAGSSDVDALMFVHPLAAEDETVGGASNVTALTEQAKRSGKPAIVSNCATSIGDWALDLVRDAPGTATGRGPRAALRGLHTLDLFARRRSALADPPPPVAPIPRPAAPPVPQPEGAMLPFEAGMRLLAEHGIPVAPYHLVPADAPPRLPAFDGPYVVKLADVGHRTEHGAVLLDVAADRLDAAVGTLREIAARDGLSPLVAVQPMLPVRGEAFVGIQNGELGPMVVFGLGGVLVEVLGRVDGRMAPLRRSDAEELVAGFADLKVMHGFRGAPAWDLDGLADILVAAGRLAVGGAGWIDTLDLNPLVVTDDGFSAVDVLCLLRD